MKNFCQCEVRSCVIKCIVSNAIFAAAALLLFGCGSQDRKEGDRPFFTSGSHEADQRADQRMAKDEQLKAASGGEKKEGIGAAVQKAVTGQAPDQPKKSLYDRLGGDAGIAAIVDDFTTRALADPRVNWARKGVKQGGLSLHYNKSVEWNASPDNVKKLKQHIAQFIALASGGPAKYDGAEMKQAHTGLHITNAEFDAAVGDLKASLDKAGVGTAEQKDLLSIIEGTRPQVVQERD